MKYTKVDEVRFWSKVMVTNSNKSCWYWKANTSHKFGYGSFRINGTTHSAHRLALIFFNREEKKNMQANHKCNNPACCNPFHLYWGTQKENIRDAIISGTFIPPPRNKSFPPTYLGEENHMAIMTNEKVKKLREKRRNGVSVKDLSKEYGISRSTVYQIIQYKSWRNI